MMLWREASCWSAPGRRWWRSSCSIGRAAGRWPALLAGTAAGRSGPVLAANVSTPIEIPDIMLNHQRTRCYGVRMYAVEGPDGFNFPQSWRCSRGCRRFRSRIAAHLWRGWFGSAGAGGIPVLASFPEPAGPARARFPTVAPPVSSVSARSARPVCAAVLRRAGVWPASARLSQRSANWCRVPLGYGAWRSPWPFPAVLAGICASLPMALFDSARPR